MEQNKYIIYVYLLLCEWVGWGGVGWELKEGVKVRKIMMYMPVHPNS
jgi:hypothetical protein